MRDTIDLAFSSCRDRGTPESLAELLRACHPEALALCARILPAHEDAEDAAQRVLLEIARHAPRMPNVAAFRSWLHQVCLARSLDIRRRATRRRHHEASGGSRGNEPAYAIDPLDDKGREDLLRAMRRLPEEDRALLVAYYFDRASLGELAESRGVSKVAVWKRLERARCRLRRALPPLIAAAIVTPSGEALAQAVPYPAGAGVSVSRVLQAFVGAKGLLAVGAFLFVAVGVVAGNSMRRPRPMILPHTLLGPVRAVSSGSAETETSRAARAVKPVVVVAPAPDGGAAGHPKAGEDRREQARALFRNTQRQRRTGERATPEMEAEFAAFSRVLNHAKEDPTGQAEGYADMAVLLVEVAAEVNGLFPPDDVRWRMQALRRELVETLQAARDGRAPARYLAVLEASLAFVRGLTPLFPQDETCRMLLADLDRILRRGSRKSMPVDTLSPEIARDWSAMLGADAAQKPVLEAAAVRLVSDLQRLTQEFAGLGPSYDEDDYMKEMLRHGAVRPYDPVRRLDYQIRAYRAQLDALARIEGVLSPEQRERLHGASPCNYAVSRQGTLIHQQD